MQSPVCVCVCVCVCVQGHSKYITSRLENHLAKSCLCVRVCTYVRVCTVVCVYACLRMHLCVCKGVCSCMHMIPPPKVPTDPAGEETTLLSPACVYIFYFGHTRGFMCVCACMLVWVYVWVCIGTSGCCNTGRRSFSALG